MIFGFTSKSYALNYVFTGAKIVGTGVALTLTAGALYQKISTVKDDYDYPVPGKMVDVGGHKLHLNCSGEKNKFLSTVILDAGSCLSSIDWTLVQPEIAKFTRVCSFDRAGMGWSEVGPTPRLSSRMVSELHTLLKNAEVDGPFLMVGHSFGGLTSQLFANTYPDKVSGVILIDGVNEDTFKKMRYADGTFFKVFSQPNLATVLSASGLLRLLMRSPPFPMEGFSSEAKKMWLAKALSTKFVRALSQEIRAGEQSYHELAMSPNMLKDKPLTVISAGKSEYNPSMHEDEREIHEERFRIWSEMQEDLVQKSSIGKRIIAVNSGHNIPHEQPDIIVYAIREMLDCLLNHGQSFYEK